MQEIINACKYLLDNGPYQSYDGICCNIGDYYNKNDLSPGDVMTELEKHFQTWENFSGDLHYPIPSTEVYCSAEDCYMSTENLWQGEQLEYRISLLNHIIKELSK